MNRRNYLATAALALAFASTALVVNAAAEQWAQYVCQKCGHKGSKFQVQGNISEYQDKQCVEVYGKQQTCTGRTVCKPCSPPG
jgi:hypothetical protein